MKDIIIRPGLYAFRWQLVVLLGLFLCGALAHRLLSEARNLNRGWYLIMALGYVAIVVASWAWLRYYAHRAVVATSEHLGILGRDGQQTRIPWSSIRSADHSTRSLGMKWDVVLASGESVTLRDIGIDVNRWGLLWGAIVNRAGREGADIHVDVSSKLLYSGWEEQDAA